MSERKHVCITFKAQIRCDFRKSVDINEESEIMAEKIDEFLALKYRNSSFLIDTIEIEDEETFHIHFNVITDMSYYYYPATLEEPADYDITFADDYSDLQKSLNNEFDNIFFIVSLNENDFEEI